MTAASKAARTGRRVTRRSMTNLWQTGLAVLVAGFLLPSASLAAEPGCRGASLLAGLAADGKLAAVEAEAAKTVNGEGRFWQIEAPESDDGAPPSHLLGTMHLGDARVLALPAPVEAAFEASDGLVLETTDVLDQTKMAAALFADPSLTTLPDGKTLSDYLGPKDEAALAARLSAKGVPLQAVERLQPWFLSSGFMLPACLKDASGGMPLVLDTSLAKRAEAAGKPVAGIETALEQLSAMAAQPIEDQMDGFVALIAAEDRLGDIFETMIELYLGEHVATIMPAIEAAVPDGGMLVGSGEGYAAFEEKMITERNRRMAERLEPHLRDGGAFVAVGALHLPGKSGLVALLRQRGYRVTRVPAPVAASVQAPILAPDDAADTPAKAAATPPIPLGMTPGAEPAARPGAAENDDAGDTKK